MVVAPAYILHVKLSEFLPFFSFGTASYCVQAILIIVIALLMRRFKISYLFAFVTAVLNGYVLDGAIFVLGLIDANGIFFRILCYVIGVVIADLGISLLLRPYIAPEAYDVFVKDLSAHYKIGFGKFKTAYDISSLAISVLLSLVFFGKLVGIGVGTLVCALVNGTLIGLMTKLCDKLFEFRDAFKFREKLE
jgi:uncharacterized membrane protein YczE